MQDSFIASQSRLHDLQPPWQSIFPRDEFEVEVLRPALTKKNNFLWSIIGESKTFLASQIIIVPRQICSSQEVCFDHSQLLPSTCLLSWLCWSSIFELVDNVIATFNIFCLGNGCITLRPPVEFVGWSKCKVCMTIIFTNILHYLNLDHLFLHGAQLIVCRQVSFTVSSIPRAVL